MTCTGADSASLLWMQFVNAAIACGRNGNIKKLSDQLESLRLGGALESVIGFFK